MDWTKRLNADAWKFLKEPRSYDLWGQEEDPRSLTCTTVALHLLRAAGVSVPRTRSLIRTGQLKSNLESLGFMNDAILSPLDFVRDDAFECVGVIDMLRMSTNVLDELLGNYMAHLLSRHVLDLGRLPLRFHMNRWALAHIAKKSVVGKGILKLHGFNEKTIPTGPTDVLALYAVLGSFLGESAAWLKKEKNAAAILRRFSVPWALEIDPSLRMSSLEADPEIGELLETAHPRLHGWFDRG